MRNSVASAVLGLAIVLPLFVVNGGASDEDTARQPEIAVEVDGSTRRISVGGDDSWQGTIEKIQALREVPRENDEQVIDTLRQNLDTLPPAYMYELARRTCASDPDGAAYLFGLAGLRMRYDAFRCVDETARAGIEATLYSLQSPDFAACVSTDRLVAAFRKLKGSNEPYASEASPWWMCSHGMAAIQAGLANKALTAGEWLKPEDEWHTAKEMVEDTMAYTLEKHGGE